MKFNASEEVILKVITGKLTEFYTKKYDGGKFVRLKRYDNAIKSLIKKGVIYIDDNNMLRLTKS